MAQMQDEKGLDRNAIDQENQNIQPFGSSGRNFEIHVKGHLNSRWSDWFEGMELKLIDTGETVLSGHIVDQAALMGILNKLNRLNITLLSINEIKEV
jgi:hypothetical protein